MSEMCPTCQRECVNKAGLAAHMRSHQPRRLKRKPTVVSAEEFLNQHFPKGVPVDKIDEIVAWKQATDQLLD